MAELDSLARLKKRRENNRVTHYWCGDQVHSHIPRIDYIRRYIAHTHTHTHSTRRCRNSCHVSINMRRTPQQPASRRSDVVVVNILPPSSQLAVLRWPISQSLFLSLFSSLLLCLYFNGLPEQTGSMASVVPPWVSECPSTYQMLVYVYICDGCWWWRPSGAAAAGCWRV
jgi:hypothetical protein